MSVMAAESKPAELLAIDVEIARLFEHAKVADEFSSALDWVQIDRLLERRHELEGSAS